MSAPDDSPLACQRVTNPNCIGIANSSLIGQITFKENSNVRMTTTKQFDRLNRLLCISSQGGAGNPACSFSYQYNNANQRVQTGLADGSYWQYVYDSLGQVVSGKRYWVDGSLVAGQQFVYGYDQMGNRTSTQAGGNQSGTGLRSATYAPNSLNQYSSHTVAGGFDVIGTTEPVASVAVNGQGTIRKDAYYRGEILLDNVNMAEPAWYYSVSVAGTCYYLDQQFSQVQNQHALVLKSPESLAYDADGNLSQDGSWDYKWDAQNRLIQLTSRLTTGVTGLPNALKRKIDFTYNHQGRRVTKTVWTWNGSNAFISPVTTRFVYDGWNLIAELDISNHLVRSYLWGPDLSGTEDGAGGIGGLLMVSGYSPAASYFTAYDGNGNLTALVKADTTDKSVAAQYEYSPYGELIRASGALASVNPFRWSTKYWDEETDLVYYGYRYYSPSMGRWINRDPSEEEGGDNLYLFVQNNPVSLVAMPYRNS